MALEEVVANPAVCVTARDGYPSTVRLLLERGADASARTPEGLTALHVAAIAGKEATAEVLLKGDHGGSYSKKDMLEALESSLQSGHQGVATLIMLQLDELGTEGHCYIHAIHVGGLFGVVVPAGDYAGSILTAVASFLAIQLGWETVYASSPTHSKDRHGESTTTKKPIRVGETGEVVGHLLTNSWWSDYGMGTESKGSGGGVLILPMWNERDAGAASALVQFVRAVNEKTTT